MNRWIWVAVAVGALLLLGGGTVVYLSTTQEGRDNEKKWMPTIQAAATRYGVPADILQRLLWEESRFKSAVIEGAQASSVGALGIAQFMPATAAAFNIDPLDPAQAIPAAAKYLSQLYKMFDSWRLAVAAYNAGAGNVQKYGDVPPFKETQKYVADIVGDRYA